MNDQDEQKLSAQVILKPADESVRFSAENATAENIQKLMPSAKDFKKAQRFFADAGFAVDAGFANSFSITGDEELFDKIFAAKISRNEKQAVKTRGADDLETSELPLEKLPGEIKKIVETVTFTEPPDFGPGNF